jgi:hypothetical protein
MTIEIFARTEHPSLHNFYEIDGMKRGGKKKKLKKSGTNKSKAIQSKAIQNINRINISLGGRGEKQESSESLLELLKKKSGLSSGSGMFSAPATTQGYFRLSEPVQPMIKPNINMAIPNNRVNAAIQVGVPHQGSSHNSHDVIQPVPTSTITPSNISTYHGSSAFMPVRPEPHRPISAVMSQMTAGRPILSDPSLPRQRPTGRDNYVAPYQGQLDAPRGMFQPIRGMFPDSREQEEQEDRQVGMFSGPRSISSQASSRTSSRSGANSEKKSR